MTAYNEFTGRALRSAPASKQYRDNYDAIFGKKPKSLVEGEDEDQLTEEVAAHLGNRDNIPVEFLNG